MSAIAAPPLRADALVRENRAEGGSNFRLRLAVDGWPGAAPGHFVMLSPGPQGAAQRFDPLLPRPMAVYRTRVGATSPEIEVLYKATGRGTRLLAETRVGERVRVVGPLGVPFALPEAGPPRRCWSAAGPGSPRSTNSRHGRRRRVPSWSCSARAVPAT